MFYRSSAQPRSTGSSTAARRITLAQSVRFARLHEQAYRDHGFELVEVPAGTIEDRVGLVRGYFRSGSGGPGSG